MNLTAVILTFNEEKHLSRCISSLDGVANRVVIVDCFSSDATLEVARSHGAKVIQNTWVNYATQFNWALTQLEETTEWVLRIDADEVLSPDLVTALREQLPKLGSEIVGVNLNRRMTFQGKMIRWGGVFPVKVLRVFRYGRGRCENRWMDEHIKVKGLTITAAGELIDDNLNNLTWWIAKHNNYASREAVDMLNLNYAFMQHDSVASFSGGSRAGFKRWLKEVCYSKLPSGIRAFIYFTYRYWFLLGFLDGKAGTAFHFLQGFWYRYLVDVKISEVERYVREHKVDVTDAIEHVLGIKVKSSNVGSLND